MTKNNEEIGLRLKEERERLGLLASHVAKIGGVFPSTYKNYEEGTREAKWDFLAAIAAAGFDILYIVTGTGNVQPKTYEIQESPPNYGVMAKKRLDKIFEDLPDYQKEEVIKTAQEKARLNRCQIELEELKKRVG